MILRTIALACLLAVTSQISRAQNRNYEVTASTTAVTVQANTGATGRTIRGNTASVYCVAAQTATVSWNGTNATATAGTALRLPGTATAATATVWTASNASGGTTGPVYHVPAGGTILIDFSLFLIEGGGGVGQNFTITTNGTCTITMAWSEA